MELRRNFDLKIKEEVVLKEEEDSDCLIHQASASNNKTRIVVKEEQQERICSLDQEDPEPPHIKEEQEELWSSQEGEQQLQGLEEADITKSTFTPVPVKSEDDDEKPQSSQLHHTQTEHMETEAAGEDCGGPGPHRDSDPDPHLQREPDFKASDSSETEVSDDDWKETREPQSGLTSLTNEDVPVSASRWRNKEKTFSCSECGKRFGCRGSLKRHVRSHTGERPFSCSVCHKRFLRKTHLTVHMITHTGEKPFSCTFCRKSFGHSGNLQIHMRIHTGEKPFGCSECGKTFGRRAHLKTHMISHSGDNPFSCSECGKTFSESSNLKRHIKTHTGEKRFSYSVCDQRLTSCKWLRNNQHESTQLQPPASSSADGEDCGGPDTDTSYVFNMNKKTEVSLETEDSADMEFWKETRRHQSGFTYQRNRKVSASDGCKPGCSEDKFKSEPSVDVNTCRQLQSGPNPLKTEDVSVSETGSNTDKNPLSSSESHQRPEDSPTLLTHESPPSGEKPFSCSVCGRSFMLELQLISHQCAGESSQLHAANKLLNSSRKHQLQVPTRLQAQLKPFSCSVCGKGFFKRESLRSHMTCHSGEKPFHCSVCNAGFSDTEALVQHMRIHTTQTQFSCSVCGEEFAWRRYLTKHMEVHSKEENYSCSVCDKTFSQPSELNYHQCVGESQLHESQTEENRETEPPASSSAENMVTEAAGEDCGGPGPDRNSHPDPDTVDRTGNCSEPETDDSGDSDFWTDNSRRLSALNSLKHDGTFNNDHFLKIHRNDTGENHAVVLSGLNGIKQEDPEPPHIKEEQEELWSSQEGEQQLQGLEEADITKSTFTPVPVKSEDDEEKPQSSQLHHTQTEHMETEAAGEDCGGPGPHRDSDPDPHLHPDTDDETGNFSDPETDDSADWKETREPQSGSNGLKQDGGPFSDSRVRVGEKPFSCSECGRRFGYKGQLKAHMLSHTGEKPFSCSVCGKGFTLSGHLNTHLLSHTGEKPFSCSFCKKYFSQRGDLKTHIRIHTGEKPFSCSVCKKYFTKRGNLKTHMTIHTGEKPFSCSFCMKSFNHRGTLNTHMRIHTGEKPFSCSLCGKVFNLRGNLKKHMLSHTGEKPFSCSVCKKSFSQRGDLKTHIRIHTGEKPFSCSVCGKGFSLSGNLKKHMLFHTGEEPFSCSVCDKSFTQRKDLKAHMMTHTGEKPFSCSFCKKSFTKRETLKRHMRIHTGEKPFSCSVCNKSLIQVREHKCSGHVTSQLHQTEENKEAEPPASSPHEEM